jgi:ArsR family metal-binding transcriptional regulator
MNKSPKINLKKIGMQKCMYYKMNLLKTSQLFVLERCLDYAKFFTSKRDQTLFSIVITIQYDKVT